MLQRNEDALSQAFNLVIELKFNADFLGLIQYWSYSDKKIIAMGFQHGMVFDCTFFSGMSADSILIEYLLITH